MKTNLEPTDKATLAINPGEQTIIPLCRTSLEEQALNFPRAFSAMPAIFKLALKTLFVFSLALTSAIWLHSPIYLYYLTAILGITVWFAVAFQVAFILILILIFARTIFQLVISEESWSVSGIKFKKLASSPTATVPWSAVEAVRLQPGNPNEFQLGICFPGTQYIVFDIDLAKVPRNMRLPLYIHACNCLLLLNPATWNGSYAGKARFKLMRAEIPSDEDYRALLKAFERHMPEGTIDPSLYLLFYGEPAISAPVHSITQLWLDQLHEGSVEPLKPGTVVNGRSITSGNKPCYRVVAELSSGGQAVTYKAVHHTDALIGQPSGKTLPEALRTASGERSEEVSDSPSDLADKTKFAVTADTNEPAHDSEFVLKEFVLKEFVLPVAGNRDDSARALANIEREYRLLSGLNHENIVKCSDMFVSGRRAYLVLSFIEGSDLKSLVRNKGPLPEAAVTDIAMQMCQVLAYLHNQSPAVVHRDVTPDNILLREDGKAFLLDFTVATHTLVPTTNSVVGKTNYIPPDQFRGEISPSCDIYALGATMHFLLTGKDPEPISVCNPNKFAPVSDALNAIVARATAQSPMERYESPEVMERALAATIAAKSS